MYTYDDLERIAWRRCDRDFEWLRTMESIIADETGKWPASDDIAPEWLIEQMI